MGAVPCWAREFKGPAEFHSELERVIPTGAVLQAQGGISGLGLERAVCTRSLGPLVKTRAVGMTLSLGRDDAITGIKSQTEPITVSGIRVKKVLHIRVTDSSGSAQTRNAHSFKNGKRIQIRKFPREDEGKCENKKGSH